MAISCEVNESGDSNMKKAIYKITNTINGKTYIGQSSHPKKRWNAHKTTKGTALNNAINKYGDKNFSFELIEWTSEYNLRERYWIAYYGSYGINGYNMNAGGEGQQRLSDVTLYGIRKDLIDSAYQLQEIAELWDVSTGTVSLINHGKAYYEEGHSYPLRYTKTANLTKADVIDLENILTDYSDSTIDKVCQELPCTRTLLYMINSGRHNLSSDEHVYPIVPFAGILGKEEVADIELQIMTTKNSLLSIAKEFNRDRGTIANIKNGKHRYSTNTLSFPLR